ncbi:hypothetical protein [Segnochrobactrum spirostomi]|uniref:DUF4064 domain-containing protein n=1 Tax=Segnochrobactrum spirostomi TaxID=2608987 RepID=A0A6A7Y9U9_9HYPH|nr:hypothetical protein [Segnochrobactrum spirostomi]MQT14422.1 hypothetical protein [Segnochrobactrum spirostomi]
MRKAGGLIALIAGIFGVLAAVFTLLVGGVGGAFEADGSKTIILLGWGGILFSFFTIVLGAITMSARSRIPAALLVVCAIAGAILGGTLVAVFMVLALMGGICGLFGSRRAVAEAA